MLEKLRPAALASALARRATEVDEASDALCAPWTPSCVRFSGFRVLAITNEGLAMPCTLPRLRALALDSGLCVQVMDCAYKLWRTVAVFQLSAVSLICALRQNVAVLCSLSWLWQVLHQLL